MNAQAFQVRVTLERIEVLDDHDPLWFNPGEIRFGSCVTVAGDRTRRRLERFPTVGVYRMHAGVQVIERTIFDAPVTAREDLTIEISGVEEDFLTPDDELAPYARRLSGDPSEWAGRYGPDDEVADPEARGDWRLWYRVDVTPQSHLVVSDPSWGPNHVDEMIRAERVDEDGNFDPTMWMRARSHRKRMLDPDPLDDMPVDPELDSETRAGATLDDRRLAVRPASDPLGIRTPGHTGRFVEVEGEGTLGGYAELAIGISLEEMAGIDPGSLRVFRWDPRRERFAVIRRSGMMPDGNVVWAKVNKPGLYGVFGLPADAARRTTLQMLKELSTWDEAFRAADIEYSFIDPICLVILCADSLGGLVQDLDRLRAIGLDDTFGIDPRELGALPLDAKGRPIGPRPRTVATEREAGGPVGGPGGVPDLPNWPRRGDICEECLGFRDPPGGIFGIPEVDLLDGVILPPPFLPDRRCTSWESVGPTNLGGRVQSLSWHPTSSNVVYAGDSQGGVYRSTNGGNTWRAMMSGELTLAVGAVAVSPSSPNVVYAGTGEYNGFRYQSGVGVYKSTDSGNDWDLTGGASLNTRYSKLIVHPTDPQIVFGAGPSGVERTTDGGETWTLILTGQCSDIVLDPNDSGTLYAGMEDGRGVQVTADALAAAPLWNPMNAGLTQAQNHSTNPNQNYIRLAAGDDAGTTVLWLQINSLSDPWPGPDAPTSTDYKLSVYRWDGATWNLVRDRNDVSYLNWCSVVACEPNDPDVVYAGGVGLEWSSDGGATWNGLGGGHADQHAIAFDPNNPNRTIIGNDGGLYRYTRGPAETTWNYPAANTHHVTIQFLNVAVSETGVFRVAGSTQDQGVLWNDHLGTTYDGLGGAEWGPVDIFALDGNIIMWDPHNDRGPVLQRTDNGGLTRRDADNGLGGLWVNELAIHPTDSDTILVATPAQDGTQAAIHLSTDGAAPAPATGFAQVQALGSNVRDIAFAPGSPNRVYAAVGNDIWGSDDTGQTWQELAQGPAGWPSIASVAVDWRDENLIYITYTNGGVRPVHRGVVDVGAPAIDWTDISGAAAFSSLPDVPAHRVVVDPLWSERLYVATDIGVFRTLDDGDWWYPFDEGLPNALVNDIAYRRAGRTLYVSTFGRGFYRRAI